MVAINETMDYFIARIIFFATIKNIIATTASEELYHSFTGDSWK